MAGTMAIYTFKILHSIASAMGEGLPHTLFDSKFFTPKKNLGGTKGGAGSCTWQLLPLIQGGHREMNGQLEKKGYPGGVGWD